MMIPKIEIVVDILRERGRQDEKFGANRPLSAPWLGILMEEVGEAATETFDGNLEDLRAELVQVAAVAVAWIESIDATTNSE